jgi:hypothetical protein
MEANMGDTKLKVRIGGDEFDGEGPEETVNRQYQDFLKARTVAVPPEPPKQPPIVNPADNKPETPASGEQSNVAKITRVDDRLVTLTAMPQGDNREVDAALLLLLGHRVLRSSDLVSADQLLGGLKQSGLGLDRADRVMGKAEAEGLITRSGVRRGVKYRLTNPGLQKAETLAKDLAGMMA